jgi:hypothetical protein
MGPAGPGATVPPQTRVRLTGMVYSRGDRQVRRKTWTEDDVMGFDEGVCAVVNES